MESCTVPETVQLMVEVAGLCCCAPALDVIRPAGMAPWRKAHKIPRARVHEVPVWLQHQPVPGRHAGRSSRRFHRPVCHLWSASGTSFPIYPVMPPAVECQRRWWVRLRDERLLSCDNYPPRGFYVLFRNTAFTCRPNPVIAAPRQIIGKSCKHYILCLRNRE